MRKAMLLALFALAASACTSAATPLPPSPTQARTSAPSPTFSVAELPAEARKLSIVFTTPGFSSAPLLEAIDLMRAAGYTIDTPALEASELTVQGVATGQFAFSSGTASGILSAIQKGAALTMLSDRVSNEWTFYTASSIGACKDLDGKKVAIGSEGAVSTAMVRAWIAKECPGIKPTYLVLGQSPTRNAAFIAGQADANLMELSDAIRLEASEPGRFKLLTSFAKTLPDLKPTPVYGNADFIKKYPAVAKDLLKAQITVHRKATADPAYLAGIVGKWIPELKDDKYLNQMANQYASLGLFNTGCGLTEAGVTYTIGFFEASKTIQPGLTAKGVSDVTLCQGVLASMPK